MEDKKLLRRVKKEGFDNLEDYVRANMHRLPEFQQKVFHMLFDNPNKATNQNECQTQNDKN